MSNEFLALMLNEMLATLSKEEKQDFYKKHPEAEAMLEKYLNEECNNETKTTTA